MAFRQPYQGMPPRSGLGLKTILWVLAIVVGLYFLNLSFLWVKISADILTLIGKYVNIITGILLIILGLFVALQRNY